MAELGSDAAGIGLKSPVSTSDGSLEDEGTVELGQVVKNVWEKEVWFLKSPLTLSGQYFLLNLSSLLCKRCSTFWIFFESIHGISDTRNSGTGECGRRVTCLWTHDLTDCPHFTDGETEVQRGRGDGPSFELRSGGARTRPGLFA